MFIRVITISLFLPGALSLKDKRQVLQSLTAKIRKFNVSVAEIGYRDQWQRAELGMAAVGSDRSYLDGLGQKIVRLIEEQYPVEITGLDIVDY